MTNKKLEITREMFSSLNELTLEQLGDFVQTASKIVFFNQKDAKSEDEAVDNLVTIFVRDFHAFKKTIMEKRNTLQNRIRKIDFGKISRDEIEYNRTILENNKLYRQAEIKRIEESLEKLTLLSKEELKEQIENDKISNVLDKEKETEGGSEEPKKGLE